MAKKNFTSRKNLQESHLTNNLQYLVKHFKVTSVALADSIGVSAELIGKLRSGALCNPSLKVLIGLGRHFNLPIQELVFRDLTVTGLDEKYRPVSYIPVVSWLHIANWQKERPVSYVASDLVIKSPTIFALQLDQDYGRMLSGSLIFVDTSLEAKNNDHVLVLSVTNKTAYIRRLIIEDATYLQSMLSEISNTTKYDRQEQKICGVVIGYQKQELLR